MLDPGSKCEIYLVGPRRHCTVHLNLARGQMSTRATFAGKLRLLNNMAKQVRPLRDLLRRGASKQSRDLTCWNAKADLRPSSRGRLCFSSPPSRPCSSSCSSPNSLPKTDTLAGSLLNQRLSFLASLSHDLSGQGTS